MENLRAILTAEMKADGTTKEACIGIAQKYCEADNLLTEEEIRLAANYEWRVLASTEGKGDREDFAIRIARLVTCAVSTLSVLISKSRFFLRFSRNLFEIQGLF